MGKRKKSVYEIVSAELQKLKEKLRDCRELTVVWTPKFQSSVHGEVKGTTIYIYEEDPKRALHTLRHEFIEYYIYKEIIKPLVSWINLQKCFIEDLLYIKKERVVENLLDLIWNREQ